MAAWGGNPSFDLFQLPEEHQELRAAIRALCEKEIAPHAADVDENARFPDEALHALVASGFNAVHVPEEYDGQGADSVAACREYLARASESGVEIVLPVDIVVGAEFAADTEVDVVEADHIPAGAMGLDIGPRSAQLYADKLADARTVFWNGPMGAFEMEPFAAGTLALAQALAGIATDPPRRTAIALTVVGGGDSAAAVRRLGFADTQFGHISTGGGASLEYLEGKALPGITILEGKS